MLVTFLFWNLKKLPLGERLSRLAVHHDVDVFVLAECPDDFDALRDDLNQRSGMAFHEPDGFARRIRIVSRLPIRAIRNRRDNEARGSLTIRRIVLPGIPDLLLAAVHCASRIWMSREGQVFDAVELGREIRRIEDEDGHERTILVGDFNMNPFDAGMIGASALHAVMTKDLARSQPRTVIGEPRRFFYNPMWGHFGDRTEGPPGTYYFESGDPAIPYWNIFDQLLVLLRYETVLVLHGWVVADFGRP